MTNDYKHKLPVVVSIAGSDSSGGAGIQADIRACSALGVYCATVITAVTAQNPSGVISLNPVGRNALRDQIDAVFGSVRPDAVKIGMIPDHQSVDIIADAIVKYDLTNVVIDPVLRSTSGVGLNSGDTLTALTSTLFPLSDLVTPNIPELNTLCQASGMSECIDKDKKAIALMDSFGLRALLVKGGHSLDNSCDDTLYTDNGAVIKYPGIRIKSAHTHGTGCTMSSAIAAALAKGMTLAESVDIAKKMVTEAITLASRIHIFQNNGPVLVSGVSFHS